MSSEELHKIKQELHQKDLEIKRLKELATKDELTGLYNRRGFMEEVTRLYKDIQYAQENPEARRHFYINCLSIIFFDIDNFKKINDNYSHKVGDQILQYIAQIIANKMRNIDIVGRLGGEEFAVALIGSHEQDAYRKAEEVRKAVKNKVKIPAWKDLQVTVSAGVASLEGGIDLQELIKRSDKAMYEAKHNRGKDTTVKFSEL